MIPMQSVSRTSIVDRGRGHPVADRDAFPPRASTVRFWMDSRRQSPTTALPGRGRRGSDAVRVLLRSRRWDLFENRWI